MCPAQHKVKKVTTTPTQYIVPAQLCTSQADWGLRASRCCVTISLPVRKGNTISTSHHLVQNNKQTKPNISGYRDILWNYTLLVNKKYSKLKSKEKKIVFY